MPVRTQGATKRKNARPAGRKPGLVARSAPARSKPAARKAARSPAVAKGARKAATAAKPSVRKPRAGAAKPRRRVAAARVSRAAAKVARPRKQPAGKEWARALKEHEDPRGPQPMLQSERIPGTHNYGQEKNRAPGRLPNTVNWFRKAPKHG